MKKLMLFGLGVVASLSALTSCKKDEVVPEGPKITFANGTTYTAKAEDTSYTFIVTTDAAGELKEIKVFDVSNSNNETQLGTTITKFSSDIKHTFNQTVNLFETNGKRKTGEVKIKVSVTDKKDQTNSSTFIIKTYETLNMFSARIMSAQFKEGKSSFFSTVNGTVYSAADAKTNSSLIDFAYCYRGVTTDVTYKAIIGAPSDEAIKVGHTNTADFSNWKTYNNTVFKLTNLTTKEFDEITDDFGFYLNKDITETHVFDLKVDNVVAFKTSAGKLGYFKVKAINAGDDTDPKTTLDDIQKNQYGSIEIDVKVQK